MADMMPEPTDDQLSLVLTDWERLIEVGVDLTTSHADCAAINALFGKRVVSLQPTVLVTSSTAISKNLQRLGKLRRRLVKMGVDGVTDSRLLAICEQLIRLKTAGHPALAEVHTTQGLEKSELLRLKDLEQWAATRLAVHSSFPDAKYALEKLDKVTSYEIRQLSPGTVDSDDSTFLKALELSAKIRKGVSCAQHYWIDRIISSKIDALQKSRAVTFSQSMSPEESSSSQPSKAKNQNDDKTNATNKQVVILQSKLEELEANIRTLKHDKKVMAEDKAALTRDKNNLALALKAIEDKKIGLQQPLSHEREAYNSLQSASQGQTDSYQKFQTEVPKTGEHLLEARRDKRSLVMDVEKLKAEMSHLSTASNTSGDRAKVFGELLGKFRGEQIRLEDNIKCISDKLEYAEGAYTAAAMDNNKLAAENAHMKAELAKSHEILAQETQLAKANSTLGAISSSLNPFWVAPPTSADISDTAEMQTTNTNINSSKHNTNTFSWAPSGDAKNSIGTNNSWGPDAATLTPSTVVDTHDWPMAASGRTPSPSGSIESEL